MTVITMTLVGWSMAKEARRNSLYFRLCLESPDSADR